MLLLMAGSHLRPSHILHSCLLLCVLATLLKGSLGIRARRSSFFLGNDDDDTTIRTEYVDRNNQTILDMFNLTRAQLSRIAAGNSAANKESSAPPRDSHYIKELRLNDIKHRLQTAFQGGTSEESQEHPQHEMAAYPICNSDSNESSWLHDNNVTIRFSDSLFEPKRDNLNLDSAILRLYKVNPNGTDHPVYDHGSAAINSNPNLSSANNKPKRCADPLLDSQIRVTVSIVQQLRRNKQRKKRICNTIMMNVSQTGWVEIDIKRAIYIWESVERQQQLHHQQQQQQQQVLGRQPILVGWLMIEVHDEEERPLKPGLFFKPPKCDQAGLAIPWNYYGPHASRSSFAADEVPRSPRLDVKLIGYASFAPKQLHSKELHDQLRLNLRRQLYHHLSYNAAEVDVDVDVDSSTTATPTVDNLLDSSASMEVRQQRHRKRHLRHDQLERLQQQQLEARPEQPEPSQQHSRQHQHRPHHHTEVSLEREQHHHHQQHQQQQQQEVSGSTLSAEGDESEQQQQPQQHPQQQHQHQQHRQHRRHHSHNHHNHHHHPNHEQDDQDPSQQQQQEEEEEEERPQQPHQKDC